MLLKINIDGYIDKYGGFGLNTLKSLVESNTDAIEIEIAINSEGGDVIEGFAIHDYIQTLKVPVNIIIEGLCASIATVIALSVPKENRSIYSNAKIMVHNPYWTPSAPIGMESDELGALAEELEATENQLANFYSAKLGLSIDEVKAMMKSETWLTSSKALEVGFVGNIINAKSTTSRKQLTIKAQIKTNTNMQNEFSKEQKSWLEAKLSAIENSFKKLFKNKFKNMVLTLQDGSEIFIDSEDDDLIGKSVFTVADGEVTTDAAADGDYTLEDGRVVVVAGGVVTELREVEDVEALKTELATAKAENENLQNQLKESQKTFENTLKEFKTFKASILNGNLDKNQDFPKGKTPEKSLVQKAIEFRNKQNKK